MTLSNVTAQISDKVLLRKINLKFKTGEHWAVVGANGSGKSALGKLLCNDLKIISGEAQIPARVDYVSFEKVNEILERERLNDDSDFMGGRIDIGITVRKFILNGDPEKEPQLHVLARQLKFTKLLDHGIKTLSTGEMRKAIICRTIIKEPEILVLDEPFDGLDLESCDVLKKLITGCIETGIQIVLLLNRFSEIIPEITHIAYIRDCALFISGPRAEILQSKALLRFHSFHYLPALQFPGAADQADLSAVVFEVPLIEMRDVTVKYDGNIVLNKLNWTVKHDQHWQVIGPNGSGKSTLLSLITGDNTQAYGNDIRLFGRKKGSGESVWDIKKQIGYISTALQQNYRVGGTARMVIISGFFDSIGVYSKYSKQQEEIALKWLEMIHMEQQRNVSFRRLSFGEQRMVLLARAMIKQPRLLILDEPCQGLDEINRAMVLKLIDYIGRKEGTQIIYVTHHPEDGIPSITNEMQLVPAEGGGCKPKYAEYL
ncbi:MAG: molybdate ABC transporter ATP-binding protein ModF [Desulfuromusa sp.]|jgi:molybdate transport system ATP-binding protein|nr:molybdate ABC transporter ATP-binding protein ModF [Desulfuromusa sp.]